LSNQIEVAAVPFAHLVVRLRPFVAGAVLATSAIAQTPSTVPGGLPPPGAEACASLQALEATLDRSADTEVVEVGPRKVTRGDIADEIRALPPILPSRPGNTARTAPPRTGVTSASRDWTC
jgi:hypothetical protein